MDDVEKKKRGNPNWLKGTSGNPAGRPKNSEINLLRDALEMAKKEKGIGLLNNIVMRAYESDTLAVAILRKLIPDMTHTEVEETKEFIINVVDYSKADQKE